MPQFFDSKNLTVQQKENWDKAKINYEKILKTNIEKEFLSLTEKDKKKLKSIYKVSDDTQLKSKMYEFGALMNNNGNEKSALFARLLEGEKPLVFRPPTSFSYPWYEVIESDDKIELTMFEDSLNVRDFIKKNEINIHQSIWKVLEVVSDKEVLITVGFWETMGFVWKLYLDNISCSDTRGFICAHHDSKLARVTTLEQLEKEQLFHVKNRFDNINLALDSEYAQKQRDISVEKYGKGFGNATFESRLNAGKQLLEQRQAQGFSDYPNEQEIALEVAKEVKRYFDRDITVDEKGNLFSYTWVLKRVSPILLGADIYMEI